MRENIETLIVDDFMAQITEGRYKAHDKFPSENEMVDIYKVPRIIIRKAYARLEEMGYMYSIQGKGRYFKEKQEQIDLILSGKESFSKKMKDKGFELISKNMFCEKISYDQRIYDELKAHKKDKVYKIGRLRIVDKRPIALHISYVAKSLFSDIHMEGKDIISMFDYYKQKGYEKFDSTKSILSVSFPTTEEKNMLECANLVPILVLETNCIDSSTQKILEYTNILYRSDSFKYIVK
ncbi:mannosyl-D-glycerate transport/metabolism system repressor MngR [Oxobacter pfennigii]|uniref:Mannosyl-D-glycerate transport/metabolism system repressor MngR n=1 Tax=Oxobacter pfennigii TaxID=36849 RepID=A0A0P8WC31_9CLOT|nr:GntR family transcriptional regulator [Oxobacter pfennigii]KPU46292.1 mannosyl-D-glycerate transport/metabolism system repressor MngR [Oxobacter pfennigii]